MYVLIWCTDLLSIKIMWNIIKEKIAINISTSIGDMCCNICLVMILWVFFFQNKKNKNQVALLNELCCLELLLYWTKLDGWKCERYVPYTIVFLKCAKFWSLLNLLKGCHSGGWKLWFTFIGSISEDKMQLVRISTTTTLTCQTMMIEGVAHPTGTN